MSQIKKCNPIPFNKPFLSGKESIYIQQALREGHLAGNGPFTKKCHQLLQEQLGCKKVLLTTSCTDALEMCAILAGISPGDEVIIPSFTFPSTANAFILRGAKIVFGDSSKANPNLDISQLPSLISPQTKAIVVVHYAGIACEMDALMEIARAHRLFVIEDAAHAIDSYYKGKHLGTIGDFGTFSFHETKNISCGEGGLLTINNEKFFSRAEIIWEKGTNRTAFFRGEVHKYGWVDIGSSFLPSDLIAAVLYAQLEEMKTIQQKRLQIWHRYFEKLLPLAQKGDLSLPTLPDEATNNAHLFYLLCSSQKQREELIAFLKSAEISAHFHYLPLHDSPFYKDQHDSRSLPLTQYYSECLLRLPLYPGLSKGEVDHVIESLHHFFGTSRNSSYRHASAIVSA